MRPRNRGRGECRVPTAPAASRAVKKAHERSHRRYSRIHPAFPHAMVLTVSFVLSPVIGLLSPSSADMVLSAPGRADVTSANLTPAPGRQDHTTSPSAKASLVSTPFDRSRENPPCDHVARLNAAASTASRPASVTIAIRPSVGQDGGGYRSDLGQTRTGIFLQMGLDRKIASQPVGQISRV